MHNVNNHSCLSIPERLKGRVLGSCEWPEGFLWCFLVVDNLKREGLKRERERGKRKKKEREREGGREGGREREGDEKEQEGRSKKKERFKQVHKNK